MILADMNAPISQGGPNLNPCRLEGRPHLPRDRDREEFANRDQLEAKIAWLRFPWEQPDREQQVARPA